MMFLIYGRLFPDYYCFEVQTIAFQFISSHAISKLLSPVPFFMAPDLPKTPLALPYFVSKFLHWAK